MFNHPRCSIIQHLWLNELVVPTVDLSVPLVAQWYKVYARKFWRTLYNASPMPLGYFLVILGSVISLCSGLIGCDSRF